MKTLAITLAVILSNFIAVAQAPAGMANVGDNYGKKINQDGAISISELPELLKSKDTVAVKVRAKALASCANKGCWMTLKIDENNEAFVKMKDYGFFVPTAISGKNVVLEGIAFTKITSVDELKHYAEDGKKSQAEIDAITKPKKEIRFLADGILIVK
ncbi:MAG: hypothetical protein K0R26_1221 [Bacteroidota bacterium]|jgi:hypothetical protein|nr:hypothetical protein [Bacteroidota bacterium]